MCGIVGFIDKKRRLSEAGKRALVERMLAVVEHRGRDGTGVHIEGQVAMGHARLAIIDPTPRGAQPFFDHERVVALSYNGELYNFRSINETLRDRAFLKTESDTETIVYAYRERGTDALGSMKGMFAFSLLDTRRQQVVLAVDRFGIKPLYIVDNEDWFAWGSEVKSLLQLPGFIPVLNQDRLSEHIVFRQVSGSSTLFSNVTRMLPAHTCSFDIATSATTYAEYWSLQMERETNADERMLLQKLRTSVTEHLVADVPVGVQLSGGVDSSLVVALASETKKDLNSYSIGLREDGWNEFEHSRAVAEQFKTKHHELVFTEDDFCRALPQLTYHMDEPVSHSHSVPTFFLAREARKDVKVLLSGEGADEIFFGYKRYLSLSNRVPRTESDFVLSNAFNAPETVARVFPSFSLEKAVGPFRSSLIRRSGENKIDWVRSVSLYDLATYLPPLLIRQDKMGMAANLENRVPFLDHELVEFGFALPEGAKISMGENKILLKNVARTLLPKSVVDRPKCGFGQPIGKWLKNKNGLGRFLLFLQGRPFIDIGTVQMFIEEHQSDIQDHTEILWTLITFELWCRIFIDRETPDAIVAKLYG